MSGGASAAAASGALSAEGALASALGAAAAIAASGASAACGGLGALVLADDGAGDGADAERQDASATSMKGKRDRIGRRVRAGREK
jgi:hypothetical protein